MKLASCKDGSRDGQLIVVSSDLSTAHYATGIATRLQQVLDDWNFLSPQLEELAQTLDHGKARHAFPFDPRRCLAPLPRAYLLAEPAGPGLAEIQLGRADRCLGPADASADGSAEGSAEGSTATPAEEAPDAHGGADAPAGPAWRVQAAVITGDIPPGASAEQALEGVRLITLMAAPQGSPGAVGAWAFAPVTVTPEALGEAWQGGRLALTLRVQRRGARAGTLALPGGAGLGDRLAALAAHQGLRAGSVVGAGNGLAETDLPRSASGERLCIDALGANGQTSFGSLLLSVGSADHAD